MKYEKCCDTQLSHRANKFLYAKGSEKSMKRPVREPQPYLTAFGRKTRLSLAEVSLYPEEFIVWE